MFPVKRIFPFLLSFIFFFIAWGGRTQEQIRIPSNVSYCDEDTGVVFKPVISVFRKVMVKKNTNPVYGTNISYVGSHESCTANIYIYALNTEPSLVSQKEFQNHCKEILRQIFEQNRQKHEIKNFELNDELQMTEKEEMLAYLVKFTFMMDEENYSSCLLMIPYGTRVIKVRVTMPSESPESLEYTQKFITEICKLYIKNKNAAFIPMKKAENMKGK